MGNALQKPITEKTTQRGGEKDRINWGVSSMQGWRVHMEDAHITEEIVAVEDTETNEIIHLNEPHYFLCVLDGHGGTKAAEYASQNLCRILCERPEFHSYARMVGEAGYLSTDDKGKKPKNKKSKKDGTNSKNKYKKQEDQKEERKATLLRRALEDAFVEADLEMLHNMIDEGLYDVPPDPRPSDSTNYQNGDDDWEVNLADPEMEVLPQPRSDAMHSASGTTATAVLVTPDLLVCANVGDSRTILDSLALSTDHKPSLPEEAKRIRAAMGMINFGRVDGELAVSRALGDYEFKAYRQCHLASTMDMEKKRALAQRLKVTPFPEVTFHHRTDTDHVLVLACDGIWDVLTNAQCHQLVQALFQEGESDPGLIAEESIDICLKKGSRDNMTILVAAFPPQPIGEGGGVLKRRERRS